MDRAKAIAMAEELVTPDVERQLIELGYTRAEGVAYLVDPNEAHAMISRRLARQYAEGGDLDASRR